MAITKQVITTLAELAAFIENSGFFDSVTVSDSTMVCKDADENTILSVYCPSGSYSSFKAYANSTDYLTNTGSMGTGDTGAKCTAYNTAKGILLAGTNNGDGMACVISKTNNGKYAVLLPSGAKSEGSVSYLVSPPRQNAIAWGDSAPFDTYVNCGAVLKQTSPYAPETGNQTIFMPIATHAALGEKSYFADAFFLPVSQYRVEGVFSDENGVKYVTDGFVCLRDE